jgi:hypothetical protein
MKVMAFENDLHDWYIDGIMLAPLEQIVLVPSEVTLFVHLYEARKKIRLSGVRRCLLDNFFIQNIIYEAKVVSVDDEPELYQAEIGRLEARYPARLSGTRPKILSISASVGMEGVIEFGDLEVTDLEPLGRAGDAA